jgi:hypothetical protein
VSEAPPTRFSSPLLLVGKLGCSFRPLASSRTGAAVAAQHAHRQQDGGARVAYSKGELDNDLCRIRSPRSAPEYLLGHWNLCNG